MKLLINKEHMKIFKRAIYQWDIIMCLIAIVLCFSFVAIFLDRSWKELISFNLPIVVGSIIGYLLGIIVFRTKH